MEVCAALFFATVGAFMPAGVARYLEYEEYKLVPANFANGEVTRGNWSGWTAFRADGVYAGEKQTKLFRYLASMTFESKLRWVVRPAEGTWTSDSRGFRCRSSPYFDYRMPPADAKCTAAAREHLPDFTFRGWRGGRVQYWNVEGATSRLVELDPKAGCEVVLWKAGLAMMGVIVAPTYKYEVTKLVLGEPPAVLFLPEIRRDVELDLPQF